jgi:hypothetical protein
MLADGDKCVAWLHKSGIFTDTRNPEFGPIRVLY